MIMVSVEMVNEEVVIVCKSSNGGDDGYMYVSLSTLYIHVGVGGKNQNFVRDSSKPMHLLTNFIVVEMDENEKEDEEEERVGCKSESKSTSCPQRH